MGKKRQSWSTNKAMDIPAEGSIFDNNPFIEALFNYIKSPEAELQSEIDDDVWKLLIDVHLDVKKRLFLWPDAEPLTLEQSIVHIHKQYPDYPGEMIEDSVLGWMEMGYAPDNLSVAQMKELDKLAGRWVSHHMQLAKSPKNR
jgi:hypothetical protein